MTKSFMRFSHNAETFYKFEKKKMFTILEKNAKHASQIYWAPVKGLIWSKNLVNVTSQEYHGQQISINCIFSSRESILFT